MKFCRTYRCYDTHRHEYRPRSWNLGLREKFGVEYFRAVAEHFRAQGLAVWVPELDPTRGIELRGDQVDDQINNAFNSGLPRSSSHCSSSPGDSFWHKYGSHLAWPHRKLLDDSSSTY